MKRILHFILPIILFLSCEEEVVLNLGSIERRLVVEALISNPSGEVVVSLSYSHGIYDTVAFDIEDKAGVFLSGPLIGQVSLINQSKGQYRLSHLPLVPNGQYTLTVEIDGRSYQAITLLPEVVQIDQVVSVPNPFSGPDSLNLITSFLDPKDQDNFFRLKVNKIRTKPSNEYYLVDDSFGKNGLISAPVYYKNFTPGDTVIVELLHITKPTYTYYNGLIDSRGGSFNSISPGNPTSNLPADLLGYWAGWGCFTDTIVVQPPANTSF